MLKPKKKITKRELKQDRLVTTYARATSFYEQYKRIISIGITVAVVVIIAAVIFIKNRADNNERALAQLADIQSFYDNGQWQTAIDGVPERNIAGLKSIVDNFGGSGGGDMARLYLADAYLQIGKHQEALDAYDDFSPSDDLLKAARYAGLAACEEALGRYDDAAGNFERAAARTTTENSAAEHLANAARNYGLAGDKEKAQELYRKLKKNYPTTQPGRDAERYITQFSM